MVPEQLPQFLMLSSCLRTQVDSSAVGWALSSYQQSCPLPAALPPPAFGASAAAASVTAVAAAAASVTAAELSLEAAAAAAAAAAVAAAAAASPCGAASLPS